MSAIEQGPAAGAPRRARWRRAVGLTTAAVLGAGVLAAIPAGAQDADGPERPDIDVPARPGGDEARLSTELREDLHAAEQGAAFAPQDRSGPRPAEVVVESTDVAATQQAVRAAGGVVVQVAGSLVEAEVPAAALDDLAGAAGTRFVREPYPLVAGAVSEGVSTTGAAAWQGAGTDGAGVKVAIVDIGFAGYQARLGSELPASVETDFSRCGGTGEDVHGTAVAEIVHDVAPAASLLLVCVEDDVDFASALPTLAGKGVRVANGSIGLAAGGRGDGSGVAGSAAAAVAALRRQGILYVAAAGNYGLSHHHQAAVGDSDGFGGEDFVDLTDDDLLEFVVAPGETAQVTVKWDAWPTTTQDFDAYVGSELCPIYLSENPQSDLGLEPVEIVVVENCTNAFEPFYLAVNRYSGGGTPRLDVFFDGAVVFVEGPTGSSLPEPATSPAVLTVGAACHATGGVQTYSGRGPTIDDRVKPDLVGPDAVSSSVYGGASGCEGGFPGTSAAAPHVAGAAALLLDANPNLDVAELHRLLQDRAQDIAPAGPDIASGTGRLQLGPAGSAPAPTPQPFASIAPVRLLDTRPGMGGTSEQGAGDIGQPVPANTNLVLDVTGVAGVPADATAVVLNVTATSPTASGWITVHPESPVPLASNLNFAPGQTVAAHVTATVGPDGNIRLYNSHGTTHLVVDVTGWYGPSGATAGFTALGAPARAFDSRPGTAYPSEGGGVASPLGPGATATMPLAGVAGVPADATAVVVNLTVTGPTAGGWFTLYPTGTARPNASSLNFVPGQTVANLVVMPVGANGQVSLFNSHGSSHAVLDVIGYLRPGSGARYVALDPPTRDLDTRTGTGWRLGPLGPTEIYPLEVARYHGVPARATAVLLNVTSVFPSTDGWLTVYPAGASVPAASNLNTVPGRVVPNAVIAALGSGAVSIFNARGATHVVSDLAGYFVAP